MTISITDSGTKSEAQANSKANDLNEYIVVTVFPCGYEDGSHLAGEQNKMERPY